jgi:hypothetical protein
MKRFYAELDNLISQYETGTVNVSDPSDRSPTTSSPRYMEGQDDVLPDGTKRRKPFRNIGNAIVDLEWRAKNIDCKSIEAHATDGDAIFSLVVNKELQQWMKDNNFGKTIDDYQRKKSEYGSVLLKKTETGDKLLMHLKR